MPHLYKDDACDENSWDRVGSMEMYPISNSCGQLGQSYQDYHCSDEEKHMECPVDPEMTITAVTHAKWWGAPGPLMCGPKSLFPQTGYWGACLSRSCIGFQVLTQAPNFTLLFQQTTRTNVITPGAIRQKHAMCMRARRQERLLTMSLIPMQMEGLMLRGVGKHL